MRLRLFVAGCVVFLFGCGPLLVPIVPPVPVDPAPITETGNRVLIVYESGVQMPAKQQVILTSSTLHAYLRERCCKDASGHPEYRMLDQNTEFTGNDDGVWPAAMAITRQSLPWIVISNGKTGYSGPLPGSVDDTLTLIRKYFEEVPK